MKKNYDTEIKQDFDWVFKILKSCETENHLVISESCFLLWCKKWSHLFEDRSYQYLLGNLQERYRIYKQKKELKYGWSTNISE